MAGATAGRRVLFFPATRSLCCLARQSSEPLASFGHDVNTLSCIQDRVLTACLEREGVEILEVGVL